MDTKFWKSAAIRMLHTMAQTALGVIGSNAVVLTDINWTMVISASVLAGIVSILKSVAIGLPEVER